MAVSQSGIWLTVLRAKCRTKDLTLQSTCMVKFLNLQLKFIASGK